MDNFEGKVAVVTGTGSGLGRALALAFAAEGAHVVAADIEASALDETAALLEERGAHANTVVTDVRSYDAVAALADHTLERHGVVDVLCNNAGVFAGGLIWERPPSDFTWLLEVNLWGILNAIRAFVPRMQEADRPAHIVNTVSMAGLCSTPFTGPYNVSKFAAMAATECLAHDLAVVGSKIKVSAITPGFIATQIAHAGRNRPADLDAPRSEDAQFVEQALDDGTREGMRPEEAARIVLQGIREEQFLIPTRPSYADQLRDRTAALVERLLPPVPNFD